MASFLGGTVIKFSIAPSTSPNPSKREVGEAPKVREEYHIQYGTWKVEHIHNLLVPTWFGAAPKIFFFLVVRCDLGLDTVLDSFVNIFQYHLPVLFPAIRMCHRVRICFPSAFVQKICFCWWGKSIFTVFVLVVENWQSGFSWPKQRRQLLFFAL